MDAVEEVGIRLLKAGRRPTRMLVGQVLFHQIKAWGRANGCHVDTKAIRTVHTFSTPSFWDLLVEEDPRLMDNFQIRWDWPRLPTKVSDLLARGVRA